MPLTLLLTIPDRQTLDAATPAHWSLLDSTDVILRTGEDVLKAMPRADRVIAIAPVARLLFIETALPAVSPAKRDSLLRYAIEDKLTIDPATVHAVVLGKTASREGGQHVVAAIDRGWLTGALAWMRHAEVDPDGLISSAAAIPVDAGTWAIELDGTHGYAKRADGFVHGFDSSTGGGAPPFGLVLALKEARDRGLAPARLVLRGNAEAAGRWSAALGIPVEQSVRKDNPQAIVTAARAENLLTGEFAPREAAAKWAALFKPALIAAGLILVSHLVFTLADNWRLDRERAALEEQMREAFRLAFPAAQSIIDPPLQMRRNLDQLKRERGIVANDDARMLVARATKLLQAAGDPASVKVLDVRAGVAIVDAELKDAGQQAALQNAVAGMPGATYNAMADSKPGVIGARITLRSGP